MEVKIPWIKSFLLVSDSQVRDKAHELYLKRNKTAGDERTDWIRAERLCVFTRAWELFGHLMLAVIAGLVVSISWHRINVLKPWKVDLALPYAYEHSYRGATQKPDDQVRAIMETTPIQTNALQTSFIFAVQNRNIRTLKKCSFHLRLPEGVEVTDPGPYIPFLPNKVYFFDLGDVNNGVVKIITDGMTQESKSRISFKFAKPDDYFFTYYFASEDMAVMKKRFVVKVGK